MQKLWIASELFYPEETSTAYILTKIANKLSAKYDVKVVCGNPVYDKLPKSTSLRLDPNIFVQRIKSVSGDKNSLLNRSLRFSILSLSILLYLLRYVKKGDKVLIVTNPAPLIILMSILKKLKGIHLIILVHDVFPENTIPAGILSHPNSIVYRLIKRIFDMAYSKANQVIVLGRDMEKVMKAKIKRFTNKPKISIIENWGDVENIYPLPRNVAFSDESLLKEKIVFQYAGNIGRVQGLLELLETIKEVKNDKIVFCFIGEGAEKTKMKNFVYRNKIHNVFFGDAFSRDEQMMILNKTDLAFVSLASGMFGLGVPSKVYNILAAGKAIMYIGEKNTEIDLLVRERNIGYSFQNSGDLLSFFNNINEGFIPDLVVKKQNARRIAEEYFSEEVILNKFYDVI